MQDFMDLRIVYKEENNFIMTYKINHILTRSLAFPVGLLFVFGFFPSVIAVAQEKKHNASVVELPRTTIKADGSSLKMAFNGLVNPNKWDIDATANPDEIGRASCRERV